MSLEDFMKYRNQVLSKIEGKQGHFIFSREVAEAIYKARPTSLAELAKVKGMPADGVRMKTYGKAIIAYFNGSHQFS